MLRCKVLGHNPSSNRETIDLIHGERHTVCKRCGEKLVLVRDAGWRIFVPNPADEAAPAAEEQPFASERVAETD